MRAVWLDTPPEVRVARDDARTGRARVPLVGVHATRARLVPPSVGEGVRRVDGSGTPRLRSGRTV